MNTDPAQFVVEVSNPYCSDGTPYERWEPESVKALADRIESETGFTAEASMEVAREVDLGGTFAHEDKETGRTVSARPVAVPVGGRS